MRDGMLKATSKATGNVGAVGTIEYDHRSNRLKGLLVETIRTSKGIRDAIGIAKEAERKDPQATRTTFRAFVNSNFLKNTLHMLGTSGTNDIEGYRIEAIVPAGGAVAGCSMVYFGKNSPSRTPEIEIVKAEMQSLACVLSGNGSAVGANAIARAKSNGYEISQISGGLGERDIGTLVGLYKEAYLRYTSEISLDTIRKMIGDGKHVFVARDQTGGIVSNFMVEERAIELSSGEKTMLYELSDSATFQKDRGRGLITALIVKTVDSLRALNPSAIIYGEARAQSVPINKAMKGAGLEYCGTLPFHCELEADRISNYNSRYENLNVWYAPFNGKIAGAL